jgi:hypothetical protein
MVRNAVSAPDYFLIASQRVVELGTRVEIWCLVFVRFATNPSEMRLGGGWRGL